jgi:DNA-binding transcriptional LysR family regulator
LLNRTTRKVELTESGERYIEYAKQAYKAVQEAENAASENDNMPTGVLRVSAPVIFGQEVLGNLLPLFLQKYPQLNIEIELTDVFSKVKIEDYDVILTAAHFFDTSYSATNISIDEARVIASPEFLAKYGTPKTPEELVNFNCLLPSSHLVPNQWVFFKGKDEIKVQVSGNVKINNPLAVRILTLEGIGISCLQLDTIYEDLKKGDLVTIFDDYKITPRAFKAIYPEKNYLPLKVKVFIDFLTEELEKISLLKKP